MKKIAIICAVLVVSGSALAADPILSALKPGKYSGSVQSFVDSSINGKKGTVAVAKSEQGTVVTFVMDGAQGKEREEWLIQGSDLIQKEYDAAGKVVANYTSSITPARPATATEATFAVHCSDRAKNVCDNGIDARNSWTLAVNGDKLTYTVWGVKSKEDRANPTAPVVKRHEFSFQPTTK